MDLVLPDNTIMHIRMDYDPQKAHDYYVRTRELHPRTKGQVKPSTGRRTTVKTNSSGSSEQRAYAAKRISELQSRLSELTTELHSRLEAARKREASSKTPTAADKSKAASDSKKYRDTHKQQIANQRKAAAAKTGGLSSKSTDEIKKEIVNIKNTLKAAVAAQRQSIANG